MKQTYNNYAIILASGNGTRFGSNIPKHYECDLAHKAKVEAPYHRLCLAGNSYLVNTKETLEENRQIIDLLDKYDLGCMCFKE